MCRLYSKGKLQATQKVGKARIGYDPYFLKAINSFSTVRGKSRFVLVTLVFYYIVLQIFAEANVL